MRTGSETGTDKLYIQSISDNFPRTLKKILKLIPVLLARA